jgi:hypothetical protein
MIMFKRIGILMLAVILVAVCAELSGRFSVSGIGGFISPAEAVVGRPLSPVSVAGVARRTARRCAAGVTC